MVAVTIWFVKTKIVKLTFVGFVLDRGNHMDLHGKTYYNKLLLCSIFLYKFSYYVGIIVTDMMKKKLKQLEMLKKDLELHYRGTFSTVTVT